MTADQFGELLLAATPDELPVMLSAASDPTLLSEWLLAYVSTNAVQSSALALHAAEIAVHLNQTHGDSVALAYSFRSKAHALRNLGRHREAIEAIDSAVSSARDVADTLLTLKVELARCDSLAFLGENAEAFSEARRIITGLRALGATKEAAKVMFNLGNVYNRQDKFVQALACYDEAEAELRDNPLDLARVNFNRASAHSELLMSEEAQALYSQVRDIFEQNNKPALMAMTDFNIGVLYHLTGQYSNALAAEQRARAVFVENDMQIEIAKSDADIADVYRALNLLTEAQAAYESAIEIFTELSLDYERGRAELGRAAIFGRLGDPDQAGAALAEAEEIFHTLGNTAQLANVGLLRAYWLRLVGDEGAVAEADSANRVFTKLRLHARAAEARYVVAEAELHQPNGTARKMSAVLKTARTYSLGWLECRGEQEIGRYLVRKGDISGALRHYRLAIDALESARTLVPGEDLHTAFISDKLSVYEDMIALLLARGNTKDVTEALNYVERSKSRLLLERVQDAIASPTRGNGGPEATTSERLSSLRARLNRLYSQIRPDGSEGQARLIESQELHATALAEVEDEYRQILRNADLEFGPEQLSLNKVATPDELKHWLDPDETLIEYYIVHGSVCVFILRQGEPVKVVSDLVCINEIERLGRRLRYHLKRVASPQEYVQAHHDELLAGNHRLLGRLYDFLIRPIFGFVKDEKVTIVPHGPLHGLPFHAFYDGSGYLIDNWEISYSPSATVRYSNRSIQDTPGSYDDLVMGVPDATLPQIKVEVESLAATLPQAQVFCGESATIETFCRLAGNARLIHLATHAIFRPENPLFSGLKFADGWLLARDLYSMRLSCDLVTLSACRTGQSQIEYGDETFGLLRGFLASGARAVAVSLWPADDAPTASLMATFHQLMAKGLSRAAALRQAQLETRQTWQHPYQWAAFVLFGER